MATRSVDSKRRILIRKMGVVRTKIHKFAGDGATVIAFLLAEAAVVVRRARQLVVVGFFGFRELSRLVQSRENWQKFGRNGSSRLGSVSAKFLAKICQISAKILPNICKKSKCV